MRNLNIKVTYKNGLFIRNNDEGLFVFNSYIGLVYAIHKDDSEKVLEWLTSTENPKFQYVKPDNFDESIYKETLGVGWLCNVDVQHDICTLLPNTKIWGKQIVFPNKPLVINWLITGKCNFSCMYCYAQDLMHDNVIEPSNFIQIRSIADKVLKINPLVVVLTGGEPTTSRFLKKIIKYLHKKVGIILDTNGSNLDDSLAMFLKEYDVVVRLSIDSFDFKIHNNQRTIIGNKSIVNVEDALSNCLKFKTVVTVQTVVTNQNIYTMSKMLHEIDKRGVKSWRLLKVQTSKYNQKNYKKLVSINLEYDKIFKKIINLHKEKFNKKISLQISRNNDSDANSVLLVSAEGDFYTEVPYKKQKYKINNLDNLQDEINIKSHYSRYLNILWEI